MKTTQIRTPSDEQFREVAETLKDEILGHWEIKNIVSGIRQVGVTEVGFVNEVYVSPGIFATLCYYHYSDRRRKPFQVNGFIVKQWRPNSQQLYKGKK